MGEPNARAGYFGDTRHSQWVHTPTAELFVPDVPGSGKPKGRKGRRETVAELGGAVLLLDRPPACQRAGHQRRTPQPQPGWRRHAQIGRRHERRQ